MRYCIISIICLVLYLPLHAQKIVQMSAVRTNDYGVAYSLPKTTIDITAYYTKTTRATGQFYQYAEQYLSITNPIKKDEALFTLDKIDAASKGVIDKDRSYQVEFNNKSTIAYLSLTQEGLICTINEEYVLAEKKSAPTATPTMQVNSDPYKYLSEEILRAGSTAKQAELIAKQIYRLRDSKTDILTGDTENMPPDGESYKLIMNQLNEQEKALTEMFTGTETTETKVYYTSITPTERDIEKKILFRFSTKLGVVDENDLAGAPVYLSLTNKNPRTEQVLTDKEKKELEKKFAQGIIYNIPNKATLSISHLNKEYAKQECDVVQFGTQDVLAPKMFEYKKQAIKIIFYPELGSIKQIIQ